MPFLLLLSDPFTPEDFLNKLIPNFWSFIINLLALIVTFVILYFVAYKPVKRYLKARKDYVKGNIEDSEKAKVTMEKREKETRHIVHDAETDDYFSFGYDEKGNLRPIEDPEEFAIVEEVFNTFVGDEDEEGL